jgi:hypothetical protein
VQPRRASAALASGAAGVGGHPVQGRGPPPPECDGLSAGYKVGPHGNLAVGDVLAGLARALRHSAASQGAGVAEDAAGAELDSGEFDGSVMGVGNTFKNIYTFIWMNV